MFPWSKETKPETPQTGKRGRKSDSSSENATYQSPESSPEVHLAKRKPVMTMDTEARDFFRKIQETLDRNEAQLKEINTAVQDLRKKQLEVPILKANVEAMKKQMLEKKVIISGIEDKADEDYNQTEQKIQTLARALGLNNIDIDFARRMGRYKEVFTSMKHSHKKR